jgi:PadR family transcriptional regulator, regulatory protein PadR
MSLPSIGELELAVLLTVARLEHDAYGANIRRDLSVRTGREHAIGAVYTTLQRIESKGLVESQMSEPTAVRGGRSKRCFQVTRLGARVLHQARTARTALWKDIPALGTI